MRPTDPDRSRPSHQPADPVEAYLVAYVEAVERGEEPPSRESLDDGARTEVAELLGLLDAGEEDDTGRGDGAVERAPGPDGGTAVAGTATDAGTGLRPRAESGFALAHRFVRPAPDVVVVGEAVREAREAAGLAVADVAAAMERRGSSIDVDAVATLEAGSASRLPPREARLLAAVLDLPLAAIEAAAEPWSSDAGGLDALRQAGADAVVLGEDVVVRTARGDHLGVLRCRGDATLLDSRTYRQAAAALLTGPWSYLAGALLVAAEAPHLALAVDALDCVTRWHAPSGLSGFSRLAEPEPIADALASYDRTYAVHWTDPQPLAGTAEQAEAQGAGPAGDDDPAGSLASRLARIVARLDDEARRARQPGKRPGYAAATRWLGALEAADVTGLLAELAAVPASEARARLDAPLTEEVAVT